MKRTVTEEMKTAAIGKFYIKGMEFETLYKRGGMQKLQKIVGTELLYQRGKSWWWDNPTICNMDYDTLVTLTAAIEIAIKKREMK